MPVEFPGDGGEEFPAAAYEYLSGERVPELVGTSDVRDVQQVTARATKSGTVFNIRFDLKQFTPNLVQSLLGQFAGYFDALAALPGVAGVSTLQDIDHANQLQDVMELVVLSTSGRTSYVLTEPQFGREVSLVAEEVAATRANLDAIEKGK